MEADKCPHCESLDTDCHDILHKIMEIICKYQCMDCGGRWNAVYKLDNIILKKREEIDH